MSRSRIAGLLRRLEDFRLLPLFVVVSMAMGITLGKIWNISNYPLTPPIEAIKQILAGRFQPSVPNLISLGVPVGLFVMMYPAMTKVRLEDLGQAVKSPRQLGIVVFFNYAVAPFFMYLLVYVFLRGNPEFFVGVVLYGFAPCIAMVIVFTYLAGGNNALALVLVAFNSIIQMLLIPVYSQLLIGNITFDVFLVGESVILYLGLPLLLGFFTRRVGVRKYGEAGFEARYDPILSALSIVGLLFTLIVMFSLKGDLIVERPWMIVEIALPMTIFFLVMFNSVFYLARQASINYEDSVAVAFNSTGRDFEIAIAIAITAFTPTVALATVVGPLIEVPVMLTLVWFAKKSRSLFKEAVKIGIAPTFAER